MSKQNNEIEINEPRLVKSHDVQLDVEYAEWIAEVKYRYRSAQVNAAVKVNGENIPRKHLNCNDPLQKLLLLNLNDNMA